MKERNIVVNEIYIPPEKPDFMSKKRLAKELDVSEDTVERWVKSEFFLNITNITSRKIEF